MKEHKFLKKKQKRPAGKKLCILLMAVFTLVMLADMANLLLTPSQSFGPGNELPVFAQEQFQPPDRGQLPEDGTFQPPEAGDFQPPEGEDFPMPGGFPSGEEGEERNPPEGEFPSFEDRPGGNRGGRQGTFLQTIRRRWLPILAACALGDLICLLILIRLRRKEKALAQVLDQESGLPPLLEEEEAEPPKRKGGFWVILLCLAVAFATILSMFPTEEEASSTAAVHQELISGTAEAAQIDTVLSGAGTLEADTLTPVTVPQQVTVLSYHVRNGETVASGDPLVSVDKTSAASAVMELSGLMEELDEDISAAKTDSQSARIASTTSGRVKKIYGWEGQKVADVMYEHGALMLLSLDGYMKVTFASGQDLSVGDSVKVHYSGGTEEGRIAAVRMGKVTVTLSDKYAPYGADATVTDESGNTIGEGKLELSSEMKVIGYYGTIEQVRVNVGDQVTADNTLFALEDVGYTTEYQILLARRNELEAQLQTLSQLAKTGMIYAENGGIISGVPEDAEIALLSSNGNSTVTANHLSAASGGWKVMLLSNSTTSTTAYYAARITKIEGSAITVQYAADPALTANSNPIEYKDAMLTEAVLDASLFAQYKPQAGDYLIYEAKTDTAAGPPTTTVTVITNYVSLSPPEAETGLTGNYAASFLQISGGKLYITYSATPVTDTSVDLSTLSSQMNTVSGFYYMTSIKEILLNGNTAALTDLKKDDLLLLTFTNGIVTNIVKAQRTTPQQPADPSQPQGDKPSGDMPTDGAGTAPSGGAGMPSGGGSFSGGSMGGMPSGMGGAMEQTYDNYIVEETALLYVSDQKEVSVTISIDELDILSVALGMEVQVTLDAVKGQSYTGKITRIASDGTNDGGNTKYEVTVLLPRAALMLDGMNASIQIVTATNHADVTVPAAALVEADGKTYVYTAYDAHTDTLGGLAEVETGASDGELAEILSGLDAGDFYYYRYADTVTYSFLSNL